MLQRHRAGAKQLPLLHYPLQQKYSLIIPYSSPKLIAKTCYSTSTLPPVENPVPQGPIRRVYPTLQAAWGEGWEASHKPWQEKGWTAGRDMLGAISRSTKRPSSTRLFSHSIATSIDRNPCRKAKLGLLPEKNTAISRLGPNVLRRDIVVSTAPIPNLRHIGIKRDADLVERFRRLELQMNKIRSKGNLNKAFECFGVLEKAIGDIVKSEAWTPAPLYEKEPTITESKGEIQKTTSNTIGVMGFPVSGIQYVEDLEFTEEPDLPYTPFTTYQISQEVLQRKQLLKDGNINKAWSHLLYLNSSKKPPRVHYYTTPHQAKQAASLFSKDKVVGFDIEWDPWVKSEYQSPRSQVSLIQIANQSDIALFHLAAFDCDDSLLVPQALRDILVSENILKVGVNITGDALRIYNFLNVIPKGLFELSDLQNLLDAIENGKDIIPRRLISLSTLTSDNLLLPLSKGKVRMSNWRKPLTEKQKEYAASDAYAGLRVFDALEERRNGLRPFPPRPPCRRMAWVTNVARKTKLVAKKTSKVLGGKLSTDDDVVGDESDETSVENVVEKGNLKRSYRNPEIEEAENWISEYISTKGSPPTASASQLRAYAMWHEGEHEIEEIARLWRGTPLKLRTVACYILEAIRLESLPYEKKRLEGLIDHAGPNVYFPGGSRLGLRNGYGL